MFNGLWTIEFISTINRYGSGVLVANDGKLLGGDNGYYYSGDYRIEGDTIQGKVAVTRYNQNIISVFGNLDQFSLSFSGQIKKDSMEAAASFDNMPELKVKIICKKKVDL